MYDSGFQIGNFKSKICVCDEKLCRNEIGNVRENER